MGAVTISIALKILMYYLGYIREHDKDMLLTTFGDMRTVVEFIKTHKIKI